MIDIISLLKSDDVAQFNSDVITSYLNYIPVRDAVRLLSTHCLGVDFDDDEATYYLNGLEVYRSPDHGWIAYF